MRETVTKKAWLHMLAEGGRWTIRELAMDTRSDYGSVNAALASMYDSGSVVRHEKAGADKAVQYSVHGPCTAPLGVSVNEFVAAAKKAMALP